jgi:beta-lactam-binding protein with PASTA domain
MPAGTYFRIRSMRLGAVLLAVAVLCAQHAAKADQLDVYVHGEEFGDQRIVAAFRVAVDGPRALAQGGLRAKSAILLHQPNGGPPLTVWSKYDRAASRQWLAEAGYKNGLNVRLHYWHKQQALAQPLVRYLLGAGFPVDEMPSDTPANASERAIAEARKGVPTVYIFAKRETFPTVKTPNTAPTDLKATTPEFQVVAPEPQVTVPDLRGMTPDDANRRYPSAEFRITPKGYISSPSPRGVIVEQDPMPGRPLPSNGNINVLLSRGLSDDVYLPVPDLTGLKPSQALSHFPNVKFTVVPSGTVQSDLPQGTIADQKPGPKQRMPANGQILVWLSEGPWREVPRVVGRTGTDAQRAIKNASLRFQEAGKEYSQLRPGHVTRQEPRGGTKVRVGTTVQVWLSAGPEPVVVPDVTGQPRADAQRAITNGNLSFQEAGKEYSQLRPGHVIRQKPPGGTKVRVGTTVQVWLSAGPEPVVVPDVRGQPRADARRDIEGSRLGFLEAGKEYSKLRPGHVTRQEPRGGTKTRVGTVVKVWLSAGPEITIVPSLMGLRETEADELLREKNFKPSVGGRDYSSEQPAGRVYQQSPAGNSQAPTGSVVRIWLSRGKPPPPWWLWLVGAGMILFTGIAIGKAVRGKSGKNKGDQPTPPKINVRQKGADSEQEIEIEGDVSAVGPALHLRTVPDRGEQEIIKIDDDEVE